VQFVHRAGEVAFSSQWPRKFMQTSLLWPISPLQNSAVPKLTALLATLHRIDQPHPVEMADCNRFCASIIVPLSGATEASLLAVRLPAGPPAFTIGLQLMELASALIVRCCLVRPVKHADKVIITTPIVVEYLLAKTLRNRECGVCQIRLWWMSPTGDW
jgi:hypothetical protein